MRSWLPLLVFIWPVGCADNQSSASADLAKPADLATQQDLAMSLASDLATSADLLAPHDLGLGAYPAGPYGNSVGATFPLLVWEGYFDPAGDAIATTKPFGAYTMDDVRKSGRAYAMIHLADYT
jgi:hypothetical protein